MTEEFETKEVNDQEKEKIKEKIIFTNDDKKLKFYEDLRRKVKSYSDKKVGKKGGELAEYLFALPDFFILVCRLAVDDRVSIKQKAFVGAIIAYLIMPIDIIPDFIPVLGQLDDLVVVVLGLNKILGEIDKQILLDNWSGEANVLELLQKITVLAGTFFNKNIMGKIMQFLARKAK